MVKKARIIYALIFGVLLFTEVCIGLFIHDDFIRPYIGDALVTALLCCLCRILVPKDVSVLPIYVFAFAALVEVAQYFDVVRLLGLENNSVISTVVGRTFSWADLICYAVGCLVFWLVEKAAHAVLRKRMM